MARSIPRSGTPPRRSRPRTRSGRTIITVNSNGTTGVPFRWLNSPAGIDTTRRNQLKLAAENANIRQPRLNWLRGSRAQEDQNVATGSPQFRDRPQPPQADYRNVWATSCRRRRSFVGKPLFMYPDVLESQPYSSFVAANDTTAERRHMVYAGANDGMLHGFDAETGVERLAFIPGAGVPEPARADPAVVHAPLLRRRHADGGRCVLCRRHGTRCSWAASTRAARASTRSTSPIRMPSARPMRTTSSCGNSRTPRLRPTWVSRTAARRSCACATASGPRSSATATTASNWQRPCCTSSTSRTGASSARSTPASARGGNGLSTPALVDLNGDSIVDLALRRRPRWATCGSST